MIRMQKANATVKVQYSPKTLWSSDNSTLKAQQIPNSVMYIKEISTYYDIINWMNLKVYLLCLLK